MVTILLEVINENSDNVGFYNPSCDGFKKTPRTINGADKAIKEMVKLIQSKDWVRDYRFMIYEDNYKYYKPTKLLYSIDSNGNITNY